MGRIFTAQQRQEPRDITREVFPESVKYEPQLALELIREIRNRLKRGQSLKPEDVAYLVDAFEKIVNGVRLTGDNRTKPSNIGAIVARALRLKRRPGQRTTAFTSNAAIYYQVKNLRGEMTLDGALSKVAGEQTAKGRPIGVDGIRKIYREQVKIFERISEIGKRIHGGGT